MFGLENLTLSNFLEQYELALNALAFLAYTIAVKRITAFNVIMLGLILLSFIHLHISRLLVPLFGVEEYEAIIGYLWYLSFAITDVVYISVSIAIINRYNLLKDRASNLILFLFGFMAFLQVTRMSIRELGYDFGHFLYENGIVFSNFIIVIVALIMAVRAVLSRAGVVKFAGREC